MQLPPSDHDLNHFVWRTNPKDPLQRLSYDWSDVWCFFQIVPCKNVGEANAEDFAHKYPLAAKIVEEAFYVDDCLTGAVSVKEGVQKQWQLCDLF